MGTRSTTTASRKGRTSAGNGPSRSAGTGSLSLTPLMDRPLWPGCARCPQCGSRQYRTGRGHAPDPGPKPPSVREVTSWIMTHPEHLRDEAAGKLHRLRERDPELDRLTLHVRKFAVMMTARHGDRL